MASLPKHLEVFITRDIIYMIGGSCVIGSFLYASGDVYPGLVPKLMLALARKEPIPLVLLAAGIAYVVGYALQDFCSIWGFVTTLDVLEPHPVVQRIVGFLYRRFTGQDYKWRDLQAMARDRDGFERKKKRAMALYLSNEDNRFEHQRTITLMQIGTTMGPCCLTSSCVVFWKYFARGKPPFDLKLGLIVLAFGLIFIAAAWLKAAQHTLHHIEAIRAFDNSKGEGPSAGVPC